MSLCKSCTVYSTQIQVNQLLKALVSAVFKLWFFCTGTVLIMALSTTLWWAQSTITQKDLGSMRGWNKTYKRWTVRKLLGLWLVATELCTQVRKYGVSILSFLCVCLIYLCGLLIDWLVVCVLLHELSTPLVYYTVCMILHVCLSLLLWWRANTKNVSHYILYGIQHIHIKCQPFIDTVYMCVPQIYRHRPIPLYSMCMLRCIWIFVC